MARRIAFYAGGWHTILEVAGHIKVYAGGAHPGWFDIKQVDFYASGWHTVWKLPAAQAAHAVKPPVHETRYHSTTASVAGSSGHFHWSIPAGRHVTSQYLTYTTSAGHPAKKVVLTSRRSTIVPAGARSPVLHYTYY